MNLWRWLIERFLYRWRSSFHRESIVEASGHQRITCAQYKAMMNCIFYLERRCQVFGLFLFGGNVALVKRIFQKIKSGEDQLYDYLCSKDAPRECAVALRRFIINSKLQILPSRCLNILGGNISDVPPRIVALDMLNLLKSEYDGPRFLFAKYYLHLMRTLTQQGYLRPREMQSIYTPFLAMPSLFRSDTPENRANTLSKATVLLEMLLLVELLEDNEALEHEIHSTLASYRCYQPKKQ
ncbi:uncharacterized protein LOC118456175 isoform X1 [Anopheles albimanus]|uniref:uncharacterized protein LOC118456175 isoform X1 n=1 Tax=Anopheles albimanus TaxID=7167 RepID=UPI0016418972|nr:uncharacterized protein LOC118456175 isoform X1 [Anopheles albimanus]